MQELFRPPTCIISCGSLSIITFDFAGFQNEKGATRPQYSIIQYTMFDFYHTDLGTPAGFQKFIAC